MPILVIFGLGFSARSYISAFGAGWERIIGSVRAPARPACPVDPADRVEILSFDGLEPVAALRGALAQADTVLVSIPPSERGEPTLECFRDEIAAAPRIRSIVYLSTVGVYGDHDGRWVDEETPPAPVSSRSSARLDAEGAWTEPGERAGMPDALLRLVGIYGRGRRPVDNVP